MEISRRIDSIVLHSLYLLTFRTVQWESVNKSNFQFPTGVNLSRCNEERIAQDLL